MWADDIDPAISLLEQAEPTNYDDIFIKKRDLAISKAAKEQITKY